MNTFTKSGFGETYEKKGAESESEKLRPSLDIRSATVTFSAVMFGPKVVFVGGIVCCGALH